MDRRFQVVVELQASLVFRFVIPEVNAFLTGVHHNQFHISLALNARCMSLQRAVDKRTPRTSSMPTAKYTNVVVFLATYWAYKIIFILVHCNGVKTLTYIST